MLRPSSPVPLLLLLLLLPAGPALAGAPALDESCKDAQGQRVPTDYDGSRQLFAEVDRVPARKREEAKEKDLSEFMIVINPERWFLGRWTQQWLYFRQCGHINEEHPIIREQLRGLRIRDEEEADCWAVRQLVEGPVKLSSRTLYAIERDM